MGISRAFGFQRKMWIFQELRVAKYAPAKKELGKGRKDQHGL